MALKFFFISLKEMTLKLKWYIAFSLAYCYSAFLF